MAKKEKKKKNQQNKKPKVSKKKKEKTPEKSTEQQFPEIETTEPERVSRPINLTLSSEQAPTQSWQETPPELNLEQSLRDAPTKPEEEPKEESYQPSTLQEKPSYDLETGEEEKPERQLMQTRGMTSSGIIQSPDLARQRNPGNVRMMRSADLQQAPGSAGTGSENKLYKTRQNPEQERAGKTGPFGESAEDTVRKYK
tara:strand:- start:1142 stop:1735 length:594 start_codon:yes stop_codon:yes gene_type:complete